MKRRPPFFILIFIAAFFAFSALVMLLWNNIVSDIFEIKQLSFWQALGLLLLCRILFGGFRFGGPRPGGRSPRGIGGKWMHMTDEEKQKFKEEWKRRKEGC